MEHFTPYILSVFALIAIALIFLHAIRPSRAPHKFNLTSLPDIHAVLNPPGTVGGLQVQLLARALPNERLIRAFSINNTFVTDSLTVHTQFVAQAKALLEPYIKGKDSERKWMDLRRMAEEAVSGCLPSAIPFTAATQLGFDTFVQAVTLKVVLAGLLGANPEVLDLDDLVIVARGINQLWCLSKTTDTMPSDVLPSINARLRAWAPGYANSLELILPSFETLWRLVATTVAYAYEDEVMKRAFSEFLENPSRARFECFGDDGRAPSGESIITETLRLHPPTKHIGRAVTPEVGSFPYFPECVRTCITRLVRAVSSSSYSVAVADIWGVQRSSVWGPYPHIFDPMRHASERRTDEQGETLLAFGSGKLKCVASNWAPRAAGVIVAAILDALDGNEKTGYTLSRPEGGQVGGRKGWRGWELRLKASKD